MGLEKRIEQRVWGGDGGKNESEEFKRGNGEVGREGIQGVFSGE